MKKEISVSRALYDDADEHTSRFIAKPGINEEIVRLISKTKNEPEWMLEKRLKGLKLFGETRTPTWGPDLSSLDFNNIIYFADPNATATKMWEDVPPEIRKTFDRLGIPEAEKTALAGVGAQYDSSIENWSKNVFNLNTKRAMVHEHAIVEWINGNMGSQRTMLYPCSVLVGEGARSESLGIAFAGPGQDQDTSAKAIHAAPDTSSIIKAKSISKGGGISTYRGLVHVTENATNTKSTVKCDALIIDNESISKTYPFMKINNNESEVTHEATVGKIGEEEIFYLMSRGIDEEQAVQMIVNGFIEPIVKALPLEYAVELNKLIELEMEGT